MDMRELELDLRRAFAKQGMILHKDDGMFVWRDDYVDRFMVFFGPYVKDKPFCGGYAQWSEM